MKKKNFTWFMAAVSVILTVSLVSCDGQKHNTLTEEEIAAGWELLFDGETLNGWRDYNGTGLTAPWVVENSTLAALGEGADEFGYIVTDKLYENFELLFDWKIAPGGNSGLLYHVVERPRISVPYATGPEYQLLDNLGFPHQVEDWQLAGADYAMYVADPAKTVLKPVGQWNNSKIVFDNGHVEYWLNSQKIVEFEAWSDDWFERKNSGKWDDYREYGLAHKGVFALQDHGDRCWFRNMKVRELPRKTQEVNLFNGVDLKGWEAFGTELWYVQDGLLVCESGPDKGYGYLATRAYYNDFDLTVEFKQEANGNSGVFIRSFVEQETRINGWQVEVAPLNRHTGSIYESYGRQWITPIPNEKEDALKFGDWNTLRIRMQGDHITTWLNGEEVVNMKDEIIGAGQGRIALQIHDGGGIKVYWRNLRLTTL